MFEGMNFGGETNPFEILKKLMEKDNIESKSEVNIDQIKVLVSFKLLSEFSKDENKSLEPLDIVANKVFPYYLELKTSLKRKGRQEIVKGLTDVNKAWIEEKNLLSGGGDKK